MSPSSLGRCAPGAGERLLIEIAVGDPAAADRNWRAWRERRSLGEMHWRGHALLPLVATRVSDGALGDDAERVSGLRRQTWIANQLHVRQLTAAIDALDSVTTPIVFKGAALASTVYEPGLRTMGDVDLAVPPDVFDTAVEQLIGAGWRLADRDVDRHRARAVTLEAVDGRPLDLHRWMLFPRLTRRDESGLWSRSVPGELVGRPIRHLDPADALIVAVAHGLTPHEPGAVRWPVDVAMLTRSADGPDLWDAVVASAAELENGPLVGAGLRFCRDELGLPVPADVVERLDAQSFDRFLAIEWRAKRAGVLPLSRVRTYVDQERATGGRPTVAGYVRLRRKSLSASGGWRESVRRRLGRLSSRLRDRRDHASTW